MIKTYNQMKIYFGNKEQEVFLQDIKAHRFSHSLQEICKAMQLNRCVLLEQIHSNQGYLIEDITCKDQFSYFEYQGDYLITKLGSCGLIVLTGDCVPVILYDKNSATIGIIHAGWKGSAQGVVLQAMKKIIEQPGVLLEGIEVFFGAGAGPCCYQVSQDFLEGFASWSFAYKAFTHRDGKMFFDNKLFITLQLKEFGISLKNIYNEHSSCTICSLQYCSFRRDRQMAGRQATVVALR